MGMPVRLDLRGRVPPCTVERVVHWLHHVDAVFSTYRPDSAISRLARGEPVAPDADVAEVLERCAQLRVATGGYFDAERGGRLDPAGLVKGWAVDRAAALLDRAGVASYCIDAGGDLRVRGRRWRVGVRHPGEPHRIAGVLELTDAAVATSGGYERGPHVVDPHTGRPPTGVRSVTIVGSDLATADAFATAAYAMGARGARWAASLPGHEAMTILDDDRVLATPGFLARCPGGSLTASLAA
jgi:thiamine biosynthesis lipoprotein